jgi:hypothetical protein
MGKEDFGFFRGSEISDPEKRVLGQGNQYRYIVVNKRADFPKMSIKKLLKEAYANSLEKVKDKTQSARGRTITKSVSSEKRRPITF